jgi:amidase
MARSAADCGAILSVIAGEDPKDTTTLPGAPPDYLAGANDGIRGLRIGYDPIWAETAVDEPTIAVVKAARETLASLGATIVEITAPDSKAVLADWTPNCAVETAVAHEGTYPSRKGEYGPALAGLIDIGRVLTALDYQKILLRRSAFKGAVAHMFYSIDLLLVPAQSFAAPSLADMAMLGQSNDMISRLLRFTCPFDSSGIQPSPCRAASPLRACLSACSWSGRICRKRCWCAPARHSNWRPTGIAAIPL